MDKDTCEPVSLPQPRSRPKQRCFKQLHHPSKRHKWEIPSLKPSQVDASAADLEHSAAPHVTFSQIELSQHEADAEGVRDKGTFGIFVAQSRPCSRPKQRCSKRLHHPSRRHKWKIPFPNVSQDFPDPKHTDCISRVQIVTQSGKAQSCKDDSLPIGVAKCKPESRSKRKCRFGPRARRIHVCKNFKHVSSVQTSELSGLGTEDLPPFFLRWDEDPSQVSVTPPSDSAGFKSFPARVTFQPSLRCQRSPFGHYKVSDAVPEFEDYSIKRAAKHLGTSVGVFEASLTSEINELLCEIESSRREALRSPDEHPGRVCDSVSQSDFCDSQKGALFSDLHDVQVDCDRKEKDPASLDRHANRLKGKCCFYPKPQRGRQKVRTSAQMSRDSPPSPPPCRSASPNLDIQGEISLPCLKGWTSGVADRRWSSWPHRGCSQEQVQLTEEVAQVVLPDRPTLSNFAPKRCSPFGRYLGLPVADPAPPPFRSVHARLGLSEEAFRALLTEEIDDVLLASVEDRRRARDLEGDTPSSSESIPVLPVLSQDDCIKLFEKNGYPSSSSPGSLLGMFWWAADLG